MTYAIAKSKLLPPA